ncbi:MAG: hypothetical protein CML68_24510 [Rhodobacteraceae bacterium]|nr:hypothetical protein [Paracoccaceae bacterium]
MIILASAALGVFIGVMTARKRGGAKLDMAQYGASFGIAFALLGLVVTVFIDRMV